MELDDVYVGNSARRRQRLFSDTTVCVVEAPSEEGVVRLK